MALHRLAVNTEAESNVGPWLHDQGDVLAAGALESGGDAGGDEAGGAGDGHDLLFLLGPFEAVFFFSGTTGTAAATVCPDRRHASAASSALTTGTRIQSVSKVEMVKTRDLRLGQRRQQRAEHAGEREVERALHGERGERLLARRLGRHAAASRRPATSRWRWP